MVRFTFRPIYPIMYICASRIPNFWSVCTISNTCMFVFMLNNWLLSFPSHHANPFEVHGSRIPTQSLIHSEVHCCYRNSVCDGVLRITISLLCTPLWIKNRLFGDLSLYSRNRDAHCVWGRRIYYCWKGLSTNCLYKIQILYWFSRSVFHFSSVSGPLQKHVLKNKINRKHKLAHTNKFRQLMAILWGHVFPMPYSYIEREKQHSGHLHWDYYSNCSYI